MTVAHHHLPVSTRHAFALAFDLAFRRDALHSLIVPLLLRAPWIVAIALLPSPDEADPRTNVPVLSSLALVADFLTLLTVSAMLRFRARSVFNTPVATHPAPALECYGRGLRRLPWLLVTEVVRSVALLFATFFLVVPAIVLGFRLSFATEAVVLDEPHLSAAFARSFGLTRQRFERWLEMIVVSVLLILLVVFIGAVLSVAFTAPPVSTWVAVMLLLLTAVTPVIQYAWTFFYLRLREDEIPGAGTTVSEAPVRA